PRGAARSAARCAVDSHGVLRDGGNPPPARRYRAAEDAYRDASRYGREPHPGLALLRLGQGRARIAAAAIRRFVGTLQAPLERARALPAYVDILIAIGDLDAAHAPGDELGRIAIRFET